MTAPSSRDDLLHELLDAYLDDELSADERSAVDSLLARSPQARAELDDIDRVRSLVRGLPDVPVPFGFYERITRRRRRVPGLAAATVGAVAAAVVLILAVTPVADRVAPPVEDLATRHAMLASATGEMPAGYEPMPMEDSGETPAPPALANGFERMAAYDAPEGMHLVYALGATRVSVFEQFGRLSWSELPDDGERVTLDGSDAWAMEMPTAQPDDPRQVTDSVVVLERDGMVITVVGRVASSDARRLAEAMPSPAEPDLAARIGDACAWLADGFGFPT
jgi:anti-sigma factor RsiW